MITLLNSIPINGADNVIAPPSAGYYAAWFDSTGQLMKKDSTGAITPVGGGGGGNVSIDPSTPLGSLLFAGENGSVQALFWPGAGYVLATAAGSSLVWVPRSTEAGGGTLQSLDDVHFINQPEVPSVLGFDGPSGKWVPWTTAQVIAQLGLRVVPPGGNATNVLAVAADGTSLEWVEASTGGGGGGGGGTVEATQQTGTIISSGTGASNGWPVENAFDGNSNTTGTTDINVNTWMGFDFGAGVQCNITRLILIADYSYNQWGSRVALEYSNDANLWVTVGTTPDVNGGDAQVTDFATAVFARYWRVRNPHDACGFQELQFWGTRRTAD